MFYMYFGTFIIDSKLFCYVLPVIWVLTLLQHLSFTFFPHLKNRTVLNNLKRVLFDTWSSLPLNNWQIKQCILISYSNVIKFLWHHVHSHGLGSTRYITHFFRSMCVFASRTPNNLCQYHLVTSLYMELHPEKFNNYWQYPCT